MNKAELSGRSLSSTSTKLMPCGCKLRLYGTEGCHLCEEAEIILARFLKATPANFEVEQCDIATSEELVVRYGIRIPVIEKAESGEELGWPFDALQLSNFLLGR